MIDSVTKSWIRGVADEQAAAAGCRMDEDRGRHVIDFMRNYLCLYEGESAGQPFTPMPWQEDFLIRLFGWVKFSPRYKREIRRFREASLWVPKKNGKSPTLAALALYLLCADGEQGQKVYLGAKDGQQAREIAGKHAIEMALSSPALMAECEINRSLMQITHRPTRSICKPISSGDSKAQKAKEGLNGSTLIDETHVVDREFIGRISRAGISRSEPLHIEVSTAGDDPASYGKERYDYGKMVERDGGNEQLLFVCYEAPPELTDEQLAAEPLRYGEMANPSWNRTIDPEEFLADYHKSRRSLSEFGRFKMYRLNLWQKGSSPWLRPGDWAKCRRTFTEEDLAGHSCFAALDLSRTRDLTALALLFPWQERVDEDTVSDCFRLLVYYFMPEETAKDRNDKAPFLEWARQGWITLTPGGTVDYRFVRRKVRELGAQFDIRELAYDPWNAEETTQQISEGVVEDGQYLEEGTGVPRILFRQTIENFAPATDEFEKLVLEGRLHHNGNAVLTWQAGHVAVKADDIDNKRPVKPDRKDSIRTIDGIVAGVMTVGRAMREANAKSVYETRGVLVL